LVKEKQELSYQTKGRGKTKRFATNERLAKVNPDNIKIYDKYLKSRIIKNRDVKNTTYKTYHSYFNIWLCFVMERWDNFDIINDTDILEEDMIDVMEDYIMFLQDELGNNKKTINTKLSAVSSFYMWAVRRKLVKAHPFDGKLDRLKNVNEEKIIAEYFLHEDDIKKIDDVLSAEKTSMSEYDWQDEILWSVAFDSACRVGALYRLSLSNLELENRRFVNIREKRGKIVSVPFTQETANRLAAYLQYREALDIDCDALFYVRKNGKWDRMSKQSLTKRVHKIGHIIGVGDFRPHSIRKTRLNQIGKKDMQLAKQLANHESMETTERFYTEKEDQSDVLNRVDALING